MCDLRLLQARDIRSGTKLVLGLYLMILEHPQCLVGFYANIKSTLAANQKKLMEFTPDQIEAWYEDCVAACTSVEEKELLVCLACMCSACTLFACTCVDN